MASRCRYRTVICFTTSRFVGLLQPMADFALLQPSLLVPYDAHHFSFLPHTFRFWTIFHTLLFVYRLVLELYILGQVYNFSIAIHGALLFATALDTMATRLGHKDYAAKGWASLSTWLCVMLACYQAGQDWGWCPVEIHITRTLLVAMGTWVWLVQQPPPQWQKVW